VPEDPGRPPTPRAARGDLRPVQYCNQFTVAPAPFFIVPSWWRRFLFRVLSPREVVIYFYICSLLDKSALAFPSQSQIANEMGIASSDIVARATRRLVHLGFFIRNVQRIRYLNRTVYQRPAPEFTVLRLLDENVINADLFPRGKERESLNDELDTTESAVIYGLRNLLGPELYDEVALHPGSRDAMRSALIQRFWQRCALRYEDALAQLDSAEASYSMPGTGSAS
jgi:hypothetical protein